MFNEVAIMLLLYMLILFSKFNTNLNTFFAFGNTYLYILLGMLAYNIGLMIANTVQSFKKKYRLKKARKEFLAKYQENLDRMNADNKA